MIMRASLKQNLVDPLRRQVEATLRRGKIPLYWCAGSNWGDALSPVLVQLLSRKRVTHSPSAHSERLLAVGSILDSANEFAEVWGSGFVRENSVIQGIPRRVHSVRGPKSRERLQEMAIACPQIYGDPALLAPFFFAPAERTDTIGVIPHYIDKDAPWIQQVRSEPQIKVIDVELETHAFIREVTSCSAILSSSLHGLICADAYEIPNLWIKLSEKVIGGRFKFEDYRLAVGSVELQPAIAKASTSAKELSRQATVHSTGFDLRPMISACPVCHDSLKSDLLAWAQSKLTVRLASR